MHYRAEIVVGDRGHFWSSLAYLGQVLSLLSYWMYMYFRIDAQIFILFAAKLLFMISDFIWMLTIPTLPARKEEQAKYKKEVIMGTIYVLHSSSVRLWYAGTQHMI